MLIAPETYSGMGPADSPRSNTKNLKIRFAVQFSQKEIRQNVRLHIMDTILAARVDREKWKPGGKFTE